MIDSILETMFGIGEGIQSFFTQMGELFTVVFDKISDAFTSIGNLFNFVKLLVSSYPSVFLDFVITLVVLTTFAIAISLMRDFL